MKRMSESECIEIIKNYISNKKLTQALMIDGPWGCGKSYFVSNSEKEFVRKNDNVIKISLYGKDSLESIQSEIYGKILGILIGGNNEDAKVRGFLAKIVPIYAFSLYNDLTEGSKLSNTIDKAKKEGLEKLLEINNKLVFIFDDFERCRINIFELMGYMNDLSENQGHKVIIVANESEIHRSENDIASAIRSWISYNDFLKFGYQDDKDRKIAKFREELENRKKELFDLEKAYEKTREKLVGITVHFQADIGDIYNKLVEKYINDDIYEELFIRYKEHIIASFNKYLKGNIRTCISVLIAAKDIISKICNVDPCKDDILEQEKIKIIDYITYSASRRANGEGVAKWPTPGYGIIDTANHLLEVFGYSFVDDYWDDYIVNTELVNRYVNEIVEREYQEKKEKEKDEKHAELALFKLDKWYKLEDEEINTYVVQMKDELKKGLYYHGEFSEILRTLIHINDPKYGSASDITDLSVVMYDTIEDEAYCNDLEEDIERLLNEEKNDDTIKRIEIKDFVNIMEKQADELSWSDLVLKTNDIDFARKYNYYAQPLVQKINRKRYVEPQDRIKKININQWDENFVKICDDIHTIAWSLGRFISYFDIDKIFSKLENATTNELYNFDAAMSKIYDDADGFTSFARDYKAIINIDIQLNNDKENQWQRFNKQKSRTRRIGLNRIQEHFNRINKTFGLSSKEKKTEENIVVEQEERFL